MSGQQAASDNAIVRAYRLGGLVIFAGSPTEFGRRAGYRVGVTRPARNPWDTAPTTPGGSSRQRPQPRSRAASFRRRTPAMAAAPIRIPADAVALWPEAVAAARSPGPRRRRRRAGLPFARSPARCVTVPSCSISSAGRLAATLWLDPPARAFAGKSVATPKSSAHCFHHRRPGIRCARSGCRPRSRGRPPAVAGPRAHRREEVNRRATSPWPTPPAWWSRPTWPPHDQRGGSARPAIDQARSRMRPGLHRAMARSPRPPTSRRCRGPRVRRRWRPSRLRGRRRHRKLWASRRSRSAPCAAVPEE